MKITAILSALAAATLVSAGTLHLPISTKSKVIPNAYIIEYHDNVKHNEARNNLNSRKIDYKVRNEYDLFNGAAITVNSNHQGKDIASVPGVKNVWPVILYDSPKVLKSNVKPTDPLATSLHHMTGMDLVFKKYKMTGKGVKVGIIDTGIDYKHPSFAAKGAKEGCFGRYGKNCRVSSGWDLVGDAYDGTNTPKPDSDPMDCQGHGTHVAGIVGGNSMNTNVTPKPPQPFIGVAPEVTFGAYRVFGCAGSSGDDIILASMEMAFNDGMDLINMSLGGGSSFKYNPTAVLADKLVAHGMAVLGAAGNDGTDGPWMVSDTGLGDLSTSVASFDNAYGNYRTFTFTGGVASPYAPAQQWGKPIELNGASLVPLFNKDGTLADGCDAAQYTGLDVKGKIVLTLGDFSRCGSGGRGAIAITAGVGGLLVQTTPYGLANLGGNPNFPMAAIEFQGGENLLAAYKKNNKGTFTWSKDPSAVLIEGGGSPSGFSSFGLDGELRSKPDIAAPGGAILSAYPLAKGGYAVLGGTSMATPYIAGVHAIYYQAKKFKPRGDVIRRVLKNTATISSNFGSKTKTSAAKQGAGLVNVLKAITTTTSITPDHLDLLDTTHFQGTQKITIKNEGKRTETYTLSHVAADALNAYPDVSKKTWPLGTPLIETDYATVSFSSSKVKIPAGKSVKVTLKFKEPKAGNAAQFPIYSGYVVATPSSKGGVEVQVPYTGVKGDIAKVPIADRDLGFPRFALYDALDEIIDDAPKGDLTVNMKTTFPAVLVRLGSHTPDRQIRVYDAQKVFRGFVSSHFQGPAFGYAGRNENVDSQGNLSVGQFIWKGRVFTSANATAPVQLPSGTYSIVAASQHKLSKGEYPADFEVFNLGNIKF